MESIGNTIGKSESRSKSNSIKEEEVGGKERSID